MDKRDWAGVFPAITTPFDEQLNVVATVTDQETPVDQLVYQWSADVGTISGQGARVTWTSRVRVGNYYDGDYTSLELTSDYRITSRATASLGWTRQDIDLPGGSFVTDLIPIKASYSFTTLASLSALLQYNGQTAQFSSNIRLALLNRSGTGLFVVYNDRRDTTRYTPIDTLGRSFVVKYTRLFDF